MVPQVWLSEQLFVRLWGSKNDVEQAGHVGIIGIFQVRDGSTGEAHRFLHTHIKILLADPITGRVDPLRSLFSLG